MVSDQEASHDAANALQNASTKQDQNREGAAI
jgi:hypothetical protein